MVLRWLPRELSDRRKRHNRPVAYLLVATPQRFDIRSQDFQIGIDILARRGAAIRQKANFC
jgi:hypothetical protein